MTAAAAVGGLVAIAALVSPPLPMFPPQGVPQPATTLSGGSVSGGGFTPAAALGVRSSKSLYQCKFFY